MRLVFLRFIMTVLFVLLISVYPQISGPRPEAALKWGTLLFANKTLIADLFIASGLTSG